MGRSAGTDRMGRFDRPLLKRRRAVPLGLAVVAALVAMVAMPGVSLASAPAPPAGFTTAFVDDFNGASGSSVSSANWRFDTGQGIFGTGEIETMTSSTSNVFLDGQGNMHVRALRDSAGNWTSGRLESNREDFMPPAGGVMRVQASIAMPNVNGSNGLGYWPAFWMLGSPIRHGLTWPGVGELDIMESINAVATEFGTMHCGSNPGGPCNESTGIGGRASCATCWGQFHTYTIEWDKSVSPETIRWFLDGSEFFSINSTRVDATTWANATNHPYFILFDLAMGGGFPAAFGGGPTSATVSGGEMVVDYVAVYMKQGGGGGTPTPTPPPTPTPTPPSGGGVSATSTIQAESFNARSAQPQTEPTTDTGGGQDVGFIGNGDWLEYNNVNFGATPLTQFQARVASGAAAGVSGLVEVHLDSLSNPAIGSFSIANTGGWQSWRTVPANMNGTTGTHTVFLKFVTGSGQNFVNVNWFTFAP
jgi:beta-glucanase (GH16 family)